MKSHGASSASRHRFSNGLTLHIAGVLSTQLAKLVEFLLNIFQVSDKASEKLQALVEEEIDGVKGSKGAPKFNSADHLRFSKRIQGSNSGGVRGSGGPQICCDHNGSISARVANMLESTALSKPT